MTQSIGEKLGYVMSGADMDLARNSMRRAIMSEGPQIETLTVPVDYDLTVEERNAAAAFDVPPDGVTSAAYPAQRSGKAELEVELLSYRCYTFAKEILAVLEERGLRPLDMAELQSIGVRNPNLQRQFPIIALDPLGRPAAVLATTKKKGRVLVLLDADKPFDGHWSFAATPK